MEGNRGARASDRSLKKKLAGGARGRVVPVERHVRWERLVQKSGLEEDLMYLLTLNQILLQVNC